MISGPTRCHPHVGELLERGLGVPPRISIVCESCANIVGVVAVVLLPDVGGLCSRLQAVQDGEAVEFQMLYGLRRDLQRSLLERGHRLRIYVPFGTEWYQYFMRRLAERPANVLFVIRSVFGERS